MSTITTTSQSAASSPLKRLISGHPLAAYFVIAYLGTWLVDLPVLLGKGGLGLFPFSFGDASILVVFLSAYSGPLLAAFLVTATTSGKAGVRALLRRFVQWRVGPGWYFAALFSSLLIWLIGLSVFYGFSLPTAFIARWSLLLSVYLPLLVLNLLDTVGEETGWRGFALPRLQAKYGPLVGTTILAILHGFWHVPLLLVQGPVSGGMFSLPFIVGFILTVIAATFLFTWIFNHARGSLLIAFLIHAGFNASSGLLALLIPAHPSLSGWANAILTSPWLDNGNLLPFAACAVLLIVFTRGRLGYRQDRAPQLIEAPRPAETPSANV